MEPDVHEPHFVVAAVVGVLDGRLEAADHVVRGAGLHAPGAPGAGSGRAGELAVVLALHVEALGRAVVGLLPVPRLKRIEMDRRRAMESIIKVLIAC